MAKTELVFDGQVATVSVEKTADGFSVTAGDSILALTPIGEHLYSVVLNGRTTLVAVVRGKDKYYLDIDSMLLEVKEPSSEGFAGGSGDHGGDKDKVFAPMPGKIVKLMVKEGDEVEIKQPLVIVEAMKMENQVNAKAKGRVKKINFAEGSQVDTEKPIIELELGE
jgi:biotin carboxyl carrier protein